MAKEQVELYKEGMFTWNECAMNKGDEKRKNKK